MYDLETNITTEQTLIENKTKMSDDVNTWGKTREKERETVSPASLMIHQSFYTLWVWLFDQHNLVKLGKLYYCMLYLQNDKWRNVSCFSHAGYTFTQKYEMAIVWLIWS
jgi:hypothetical protein